MADNAASFSIVAEPSAEIRQALVEALGAFNESKVGPSEDGTYAVVQPITPLVCKRFGKYRGAIDRVD